MLGAAVAEFDFCAHGGEEFAFCFYVVDLGNVFKGDFVFGENGSGHAGKRGVFCSRDTDGADEGIAATNDEFIHRNYVTPE